MAGGGCSPVHSNTLLVSPDDYSNGRAAAHRVQRVDSWKPDGQILTTEQQHVDYNFYRRTNAFISDAIPIELSTARESPWTKPRLKTP